MNAPSESSVYELRAVCYEDEDARLVQNVRSAEESLARVMSSYGGMAAWNNERERLHLSKCFEGVAAALSMRAAFMRLVANQIFPGCVSEEWVENARHSAKSPQIRNSQ